mmetsp:Transcript_5501/g.8206  ORF Transcript_5501/g.8206 Transcript_5501/m.8206 type:complete len:169 (-) Transcript_5501:569-1075(-)
METACSGDYECGEFLCEHNAYEVISETKVRDLLGMISKRKEEVVRATENIMLQVEKIAYRQLCQLRKLRQRVIGMEDINQVRKDLDAIEPCREHLNELKSLVKALGCEKLSNMVSGSEDKAVRIWENGKARVLEGHGGKVWSVVVSLKKGIVVSGSADKTLRVWSLAS